MLLRDPQVPYFNCVEGIGSLFLMDVYCKHKDILILLSCVDRNGNIYLCLRTSIIHDDEINVRCKWLVAQIDPEERFQSFLDSKIDVRSMFVYPTFIWIVIQNKRGEWSYLDESCFHTDEFPFPNIYLVNGELISVIV